MPEKSMLGFDLSGFLVEDHGEHWSMSPRYPLPTDYIEYFGCEPWPMWDESKDGSSASGMGIKEHCDLWSVEKLPNLAWRVSAKAARGGKRFVARTPEDSRIDPWELVKIVLHASQKARDAWKHEVPA